jgi:hypothetical protein
MVEKTTIDKSNLDTLCGDSVRHLEGLRRICTA